MQTVDEPAERTAVFASFVVYAHDGAGETVSEAGSVDLVPADVSSFVPFDQVDAKRRVEMVKDALRRPGKDSPETIEQRLTDQLSTVSASETHVF